MSITPYDNSFKLCKYWFMNAKNNILNEEILNLQVSFHGDFSYITQAIKTLIRIIMSDQQEEILEDNSICFATKLYSVYFTTTTDVPDIQYEQNRNIIFVTSHIPYFIEIDRPIFCVSLKNYSLDLNSRFRKDPLNEMLLNNLINSSGHYLSKPTLTQEERYANYINRLPLMELMRSKQYQKIGEYIYNMTIREPYPFMFRRILLNTEYLSNKYHFQDLILDDIKMFINEKVLSLRLSIIVYKLSFLEFDQDESIITKFFSQKLGLGNSEYLSLDNLNFISRDLNTSTAYNVYDLRYLESKQINMAKEIIKNQKNRYGNEPEFEFDIESIYEATHLSYNTIEQLIKGGI